MRLSNERSPRDPPTSPGRRRSDRIGSIGAARRCPLAPSDNHDVRDVPNDCGVFYAVLTTDVTGPETEGSTPTFATQSQLWYCLNLGTAVPPLNSTIVRREHRRYFCNEVRWLTSEPDGTAACRTPHGEPAVISPAQLKST